MRQFASHRNYLKFAGSPISRSDSCEARQVVNYTRHVRSNLSDRDIGELSKVDALAEQLLVQMELGSGEIGLAHVHNAQSGAIQELISAILLLKMGFEEEVVLKPEDEFVTYARPDFYFDLGDSRGILAEVERGGTTTNNHDLKDLWKAHVAPNAQHLFLVVPNSNWKPDGSAREKPYAIVARRLGAFFGNPRREVDVVSLHVFGY